MRKLKHSCIMLACVFIFLTCCNCIVYGQDTQTAEMVDREYTDLFTGYAHYLDQELNCAATNISEAAGRTIEERSLGDITLAHIETTMETIGDLSKILTAILDSVGVTDFSGNDAADAAAMAVMRSYYSESKHVEVVLDTSENVASDFNALAESIIELKNTEGFFPEQGNSSAEDFFWKCFDKICEKINDFGSITIGRTRMRIDVATRLREAVYKSVLIDTGKVDTIESVISFTNTLVKYAALGTIEIELIDYILENNMASPEMAAAFRRLQDDIHANWLVYVLENYVAGKLGDLAFEVVERLILGNATAVFELVSVSLSFTQWVVFDLIMDTANCRDWMIYTHLLGFYRWSTNILEEKINYIKTNPIYYEDIEDLKTAFSIYAAIINALFEQADVVGGEGLDETYKYMCSYDAYITHCKAFVASIPLNERVVRKRDYTKTYQLSGNAYISYTAPTEEYDFWVIPFQGEILYDVRYASWGSSLYIMQDTTFGNLTCCGNLDAPNREINILGDLAICNELSFSEGTICVENSTITVGGDVILQGEPDIQLTDVTLDIKGDFNVSANLSYPKLYIDNGEVYVHGDMHVYCGGSVYCGTGILQIDGDYYGDIIGNTTHSQIFIESGTVTVGENMKIIGTSWTGGTDIITMNQSKGYLLVKGNLSVGTRSCFTAGTLEVWGDCIISSFLETYGGSHQTILSGDTIQTIQGNYNILHIKHPWVIFSGNYNQCVTYETLKNDNISVFADSETSAGSLVFGTPNEEEFLQLPTGVADRIQVSVSLQTAEQAALTETVTLCVPVSNANASYAVYRVKDVFITPITSIYDGRGNIVFEADRLGTYIITDQSCITVNYGDPTKDGQMNLLDVLRVLRYCCDNETDMDVPASDVTKDEQVDIRDALQLIRTLLQRKGNS